MPAPTATQQAGFAPASDEARRCVTKTPWGAKFAQRVWLAALTVPQLAHPGPPELGFFEMLAQAPRHGWDARRESLSVSTLEFVNAGIVRTALQWHSRGSRVRVSERGAT